MKKRKSLILLFVIAALAVLGFYPLDSYISRPGGAYELSPFVEVAGGDEDDEGTFSLLTIALAKATPLTYAYAKVADNHKIYKASQVRREDEDEEEYNVRQLKLMSDSQFNAITVAFDRANKPFTVTNHGIFVFNVVDGSGADGILQAGDKILEMDNLPELSGEAIGEHLTDKQEGDVITLKIERDDKVLTKEVTIQMIPERGTVGIGIEYAENKIVETTPPVKINSEEIGGPSAGLMFTLEILNQLLPEDITKGYKIAGTGEMLEDGTVGRIGGIDLKVVAADKEGNDIMFAPDDDIDPEVLKKNPDVLSNYEEALKTAEKTGTTMKIVPVKTIDDALDYLESLPPKK